MRILSVILFASFIFSCKDRKNISKPDISEHKTESFYRLDSSENAENLFYPVFELSPKTTALVINFSENDKKNLLDKLFDQVLHLDSTYSVSEIPKNCKIYDALGAYRLIKSDKLETEILKYFNREFYVYGTHGNAKAKIKDIVFGLDECRTNIFAFCLDNSNIKSIGHPIFCSEKLIDLKYLNDYDGIERNIENYLSKNPGDYNDSISVRVLGNVDNFYFTYNDDFLWGQKPDKAKCKFPARSIYIIDKNNKISRYWAEDLDLFGIPCD